MLNDEAKGIGEFSLGCIIHYQTIVLKHWLDKAKGLANLLEYYPLEMPELQGIHERQ